MKRETCSFLHFVINSVFVFLFFCFIISEGGNDPKYNPKLEKLIAEAKKADMSNAMIESAINQAVSICK